MSDLPLDYRHRAGDGDAAVLVLHGLGADETDLLPLTADLPDSHHVVSIRAPDRHGPGYSWFGFDGPDPTSAGPVAEDLRWSRELLDDCRAAAVEVWDLDPDRVGLLGFSQGAMLALTALVEAPEAYPWAVASHGYLPDAADSAGEVDAAAFVSVGEADRVVPPERGREAAARLRELGCAVTERSYPVGHGVAPDEAADLAAWVRERYATYAVRVHHESMETTHHHVVGDSRSMDALADDSVELVVTSPPYPMIEMWDEAFAAMDPAVSDHLDAGRGETAFEAMHACLDETWAEVERVLVEGGIACVTVGDATRTLDRFARYPNAARVTRWFTGAGFDALPEVVWRKPTNSAAKFMGSGMVPPNAYVTLEHEHVLVFRNGGGRTFPPGDDARYEAAYFWEERNRWFSDLWTDVGGALQDLDDDDLRDRTAAFPIEVPYRLINMYSVYGDTVLDPFWGTGTTSLAAMVAARDSVGYERDSGFVDVFAERAADAPALSRSVGRRRLADHEAFVERREQAPGYEATHYDVAVVSKQERDIRLYAVESVRRDGDTHVATHAPLDS